MNNNMRDTRHPAAQLSGPNKYLQLSKLSKAPLTIHFNDGQVVDNCLLLEFDALNLLLSVVATGREMIVYAQLSQNG